MRRKHYKAEEGLSFRLMWIEQRTIPKYAQAMQTKIL